MGEDNCQITVFFIAWKGKLQNTFSRVQTLQVEHIVKCENMVFAKVLAVFFSGSVDKMEDWRDDDHCFLHFFGCGPHAFDLGLLSPLGFFGFLCFGFLTFAASGLAGGTGLTAGSVAGFGTVVVPAVVATGLSVVAGVVVVGAADAGASSVWKRAANATSAMSRQQRIVRILI